MIIVSREILAEYSPFVWMGSYGFRADAASVAIEVGGGNQIGQFQVAFFAIGILPLALIHATV